MKKGSAKKAARRRQATSWKQLKNGKKARVATSFTRVGHELFPQMDLAGAGHIVGHIEVRRMSHLQPSFLEGQEPSPVFDKRPTYIFKYPCGNLIEIEDPLSVETFR